MADHPYKRPIPTFRPEQIAAKRARHARIVQSVIASLAAHRGKLDPNDRGLILARAKLVRDNKLAAIAGGREVAQRLPPRVRGGVLHYLDGATRAAEQELAAVQHEMAVIEQEIAAVYRRILQQPMKGEP